MIGSLIRLLVVATALGPLPAVAAPLAQELTGPGSGPELLEPEQAFKMLARALGPSAVEVEFAIAKGYYMYRDRFAFAAQGTQVKLGSPQLPPAQHHKDPYFGEVYTYRDHVAIRLPLQSCPATAQALELVVTSPAELAERLRAPGRPVMLDFYADWCVSCKEMENFTFRDPRVRAKLGDMLLLRADVTANTADDKALLSRFSLFGPPGIIFFDGAGREIRGLRVVGYQDAAQFLQTLARAADA